MTSLDPRRWFDRMHPQTLQIATWLLYLNGFFDAIAVLDTTGYLGYLRVRYGFGIVLGLLLIAASAGGGWLMANDRKWGYYVAIGAAFGPFVLRYFAFRDAPASFFDKLTGGSSLSTIFEVALIALLLHPQSRNHQRIWFK
ncbi:MAG: hypothetical protein WCL35_04735 [bacterium]